MLHKIAFCGLAALLVSGTCAYADIYDAAANFPTAIHVGTLPFSGPWTYGLATTLTPVVDFAPDTNATSDYFGDGGNASGFYTPTAGVYSGGALYDLPTILRNDTGAPLTEYTLVNWSPSVLLLHPGPSGDYSVIQFTAPVTGVYSINGLFTALDENPLGVTSDGVLESITLGSTVLYSTTSRTDVQNTFSLTETMTAGENLDFTVGVGPDGEFYNDSTGFDATITSTVASTPEPGFYGVLAVGLAGLAFAVRRFRARA